MFIRKFLGWEEASFHEYQDCYLQYGGNFSTHPEVLCYIHNHAECKEKYYVHQTSGKVDGAVCVWVNKYLGNDIASCELVDHLGLPVAKDELILPITKEKKIFIPFTSKIVSPINHNIINCSELLNARRTICLAKPLDGFSKRTTSSWNRVLNRFLKEGGEIKDQSEFTASDIIEMYSSLFKKRRGHEILNKEQVLDFIKNFRENIFGKLLFYKDTPCAYQFITRYDSCNFVLLDFINIGIDTDLKQYAPGILLMWINLNEAHNIAKKENKTIRFSFGRPTAEYKNRWCYQEKLGKIL